MPLSSVLVIEKEHWIRRQKMKANLNLSLYFLTHKIEIIMPFSVVIRIKNIFVNMVNFKSFCKYKVLLL